VDRHRPVAARVGNRPARTPTTSPRPASRAVSAAEGPAAGDLPPARPAVRHRRRPRYLGPRRGTARRDAGMPTRAAPGAGAGPRPGDQAQQPDRSRQPDPALAAAPRCGAGAEPVRRQPAETACSGRVHTGGTMGQLLGRCCRRCGDIPCASAPAERAPGSGPETAPAPPARRKGPVRNCGIAGPRGSGGTGRTTALVVRLRLFPQVAPSCVRMCTPPGWSIPHPTSRDAGNIGDLDSCRRQTIASHPGLGRCACTSC
jgi:hypothetical protein